MDDPYPQWSYFPTRTRSPEWVSSFIASVLAVRDHIDSRKVDSLNSDRVLKALEPSLVGLGYTVEAGKLLGQKIRRPVLFGENGLERVTYEVDAVHDELGIILEIEAGRGARGNAVYRDLIRSSLIYGMRYLALGVMLEYRHLNKGKLTKVQSYRDARDQLEAIYASGRLVLPFDGILLFGY